MFYDVVIVGAGMGGLVSGALLSKRGFNVLILEKSGDICERTISLDKDGFILDYGIHLARFGTKGVIATTMKELRKDIEIVRPGRSVIYWEERFETLPL
nr:NAD(P)-binding protein [Candidatus Baldrarchaeota archaeon]